MALGPQFIHHVTHARDNAIEAKDNGYDRLTYPAQVGVEPVRLLLPKAERRLSRAIYDRNWSLKSCLRRPKQQPFERASLQQTVQSTG